MDKEIIRITKKIKRLKAAKREGEELLRKVNEAIGVAEIALVSLMVEKW